MPDSGILPSMEAFSKRGFVGRSMRFAVWLCVAGCAVAQGTPRAPVQDSDGMTTLHVYTNLAQVPVMVLAPNRERLSKDIDPKRFVVSIDNGPWFTATHVRREGDDPIELGILLDLRGSASEAIPDIQKAIAGLAPGLLHTADHVTVYGLDCTLTRGPGGVIANEENLERSTEFALSGWELRKKSRPAEKCQQRASLVNALTGIIRELSTAPGRRVIVVATDGQDDVNKEGWVNLSTYAQMSSVPIFGVVIIPMTTQLPSYVGRMRQDDPFTAVCDMSGGMVTMTTSLRVQQVMGGLITTLRDRYIVEFPRPSNSTAGRHLLNIRVEKSNDFIRMSGITMSLPSASVLKDPNTILIGPANTPIQGDKGGDKDPLEKK